MQPPQLPASTLPRTILVVDDSPADLHLVAAMFRQRGHSVLEAANGAEALLALASVRPDAVVSDGLMPILDGYQLCRLVKDEPSTRHIPVVLLTGQAEGLSRFWARTCGADLFLIKGRDTTGVVAVTLGLVSHSGESPGRDGNTGFDPQELGLDAIHERLRKALEHRLLQTALRDAIGHLYTLHLDPSDLIRKVLDLLHELVLPGAIHLAIPGEAGHAGAGCYCSGVGEAEREAIQAAAAQVMGWEGAWPSTWEEVPPLRAEAAELCQPALLSLPIGEPGVAASGCMTLYAEQRTLREHERLFEVACQELARLLDLAESRRQLSRSEEALRQAQKAESLALMAGGIAHDFNNLFQSITANLELMAMLTAGQREKNLLGNLLAAVKKGGGLAGQMLEFSGHMWKVDIPLDLNALAREAIEACHQEADSVQFVADLAEDLPPVVGDQNHLLQALAHLLRNAAEAIGAGPGRITITTSVADWKEDKDTPRGRWLTNVPAGQAICLSITDDGCGASEQVLSRMFDPFYTTKQLGRGLGLPATLGIIKAHQAALQVESRAGAGSTFRLWFPVVGSSRPTTKASPTKA